MAKNALEQQIADAAKILGVPDGFEVVALKLALDKEGETVTGVYDGMAPDIEMSGKIVHRYKISTEPGKMVTVLGAAQIDQFFDSIKVGDSVWIKRGAQRKGGKGKINDYQFAVKRA